MRREGTDKSGTVTIIQYTATAEECSDASVRYCEHAIDTRLMAFMYAASHIRGPKPVIVDWLTVTLHLYATSIP